jgi:hypothetical protein
VFHGISPAHPDAWLLGIFLLTVFGLPLLAPWLGVDSRPTDKTRWL